MRAALVCACAWLCLAAAPQTQPRTARAPFTVDDADRFATKYAAIVARGADTPGPRRKSIRTVITEAELNAYLRYRGKDVVPAGLVDPYVYALGEGRLSGVATIDLDAVRLSRPRGVLDVAQLLRGTLPVHASGVLRSRDGQFRFELESATLAGVQMPRALLEELVAYYTRSASNPSGRSLDAPFGLGAGIRDVTVESKRAIIVQ